MERGADLTTTGIRALSEKEKETLLRHPPPEGYRMVKVRTDYANKAGTIETLSLVHEDGSWRVVGVTVE